MLVHDYHFEEFGDSYDSVTVSSFHPHTSLTSNIIKWCSVIDMETLIFQVQYFAESGEDEDDDDDFVVKDSDDDSMF